MRSNLIFSKFNGLTAVKPLQEVTIVWGSEKSRGQRHLFVFHCDNWLAIGEVKSSIYCQHVNSNRYSDRIRLTSLSQENNHQATTLTEIPPRFILSLIYPWNHVVWIPFPPSLNKLPLLYIIPSLARYFTTAADMSIHLVFFNQSLMLSWAGWWNQPFQFDLEFLCNNGRFRCRRERHD